MIKQFVIHRIQINSYYEGSINDDSFEAEYIKFCLNIIYNLDMTIFNKYNTLFGKKKFCSKKKQMRNV